MAAGMMATRRLLQAQQREYDIVHAAMIHDPDVPFARSISSGRSSAESGLDWGKVAAESEINVPIVGDFSVS